jgi:predicted Zn finger-like uncharacterized protein
VPPVALWRENASFPVSNRGWHGFRSINGRLIPWRRHHDADAMLIVCPSCATSYMIDPVTLGPAGRTVRCARCKATWFAGGPEPKLTAFVDGVIAEAEARSPSGGPDASLHRTTDTRPPPVHSPSAAGDPAAKPAEPVPEPVPPEIAMTGDGVTQDSQPDAAVQTIVEAPSLVPPPGHEPLPDSANTEVDSEDVESYAARRTRLATRRKQSRRSSRWTAIVLVLFSVNVALIGARDEVVRTLPQTASLFAAIGLPVNLRHLKFENVKIVKDVENGVNVLIVQGTIVSTADRPIAVPHLRFAARDAAGQEIYTWTALPSRSILGPGERLEFRSRLTSPPADASNVMVRFFTPQDAAAGAK